MTVKAALLDARGVFKGMAELADESEITPLHLPQITECDLPPDLYKWIDRPGNEFGGAFWPISFLEHTARLEAAAREALAQKTQRDALGARPPRHRPVTPARRSTR